MKTTIFLITTLLSFFSVPVFAEDLDTLDLPWMKRIESTRTGALLIEKLNTEFDRLTAKGYTSEDYDLLSESEIDIIANTVLPPNGANLSSTELDEYRTEQDYLITEVGQYAVDLNNDIERVMFFVSATWYMSEFIYAD